MDTIKQFVHWYFNMNFQTAILWAGSIALLVWSYILYKWSSSHFSSGCSTCRNTGINKHNRDYCFCAKGHKLARKYDKDIEIQRIYTHGSSYASDPRD